MTRCYRPWSKFNAHQWSNLNERGQFDLQIEPTLIIQAVEFFLGLGVATMCVGKHGDGLLVAVTA